MKTILFGAFGRHNFGDMLFPHIFEKLIHKNSLDLDIEFCDVLSRDMSKSGGHQVKAISDFFDYTKSINVIMVGGEVGNCSLKNSIEMFAPTSENQEQLFKLYNQNIKLAYLLEKRNFKHPNIFICNTIGGQSENAYHIIKNFEYVSIRDKYSFDKYTEYSDAQKNCFYYIPDSVILLRDFFENKIQDRIKISHSLIEMKNKIGNRYVAVQFKPSQVGNCIEELRKQLSRIISDLNLPIVFFCAGTAVGHDSLSFYKEMFLDCLPTAKTYFFNCENIWDICFLISKAECVLSTSLHVRIVASCYARPRITLNLMELDEKEAPQYRKTCSFINEWDSIKNSDKKMINLIDNVNESIVQNDIKSQLRHNEGLKDIFYKNSSWINQFVHEEPRKIN